MTRMISTVLAAVAVLAVIGGIWWATSDDGGEPSQGVPAAGGAAGPGSSDGSGLPEPRLPTDPGISEPGTPDGPLRPVPVTGYRVLPDGRLLVGYTIGVPACYGRIIPPEVTESADAVTVTLTRREPKPDPAVSCIDIALVEKVRIALAAPLGDRVVRDGSFGGVVDPGAMPPSDGSGPGAR